MRWASILLFAGSMSVTTSGCGAACPRVLHTDPARLAADYASMRSPVREVRAEARVERRDAGGRVRGTVFMLLRRPDHVRFDVMTQFGPAAILTSDGETFALTDLRENRFLVGEACAENIGRLLGIPMEAEDIGHILLGEPPRFAAESETMSCDGGRYHVERIAADGSRLRLELEVRAADLEADLEEQRLRLRRAEHVDASGATDWTLTWDAYDVVEDPLDTESPRRGVAMPGRIRFVHTALGIDTEVRFQSLELNVEIPEGSFEQDPRGGLSVEPVECGM